MRPLRMPAVGALAVAAAVLSAGTLVASGVIATPAQASNSTVTVTNTAAGTLQTQLSTNNVWSGMLDQFPTAIKNFRALGLPLVRIHVGDDGSPAAMPDINKGSWNFSALNALVNDVTGGGQRPLMNIKFAPDWMWSCYPSSIGVNGSQGTGTVKDTTFQTFAQYMARLVSYYNTGSMTTENGTVITNPAGTSNRVDYWELWNEPDLNNETPCAPSSGVALTPSQYLTMWNAVTAAMLQVDPTLKFIGPATAGGQFGSGATDYFTPLMSQAAVKPYALSFHGYGYWDNSVPDKWLFDGDGTDGGGGIASIAQTTDALHAAYPTTPLWLTEVNVNAAWDNDTYKRPWTALGAAWWASMFSQLAPANAGLINQYEVMESPQFGLLNDQDGTPYLPYWTEKVLNSAFPSGSQILSATSTNSQIQTLAARRADGKIAILVVNRQLDSATSKGGPGLPATVGITLNGITPETVSEQQIDSTTSSSSGPTTRTVDPSAPLSVSLPGYGFAIVTITPSGSGGPAPTPSPSPSGAADTTAPSVAMTAPAGPAALGSSTTARWRGSDAGSGVASYDVRWNAARWNGGFGGWHQPASMQHLVATHTTLTGLLPGYTYCFAVRARDHAGNVSRWSASRCLARPLDDRSLSRSRGWTRRTGSAFFLHTDTSTTGAGRSLWRTSARVARVGLVVTTCPTCGRVAVYVGGRRVGTAQLHSSSTRHRRIIMFPAFRPRTATVRLVVLTAAHPVSVDAVVLSRS